MNLLFFSWFVDDKDFSFFLPTITFEHSHVQIIEKRKMLKSTIYTNGPVT